MTTQTTVSELMAFLAAHPGDAPVIVGVTSRLGRDYQIQHVETSFEDGAVFINVDMTDAIG